MTNVCAEMQTDPPPRKNFNDTVNQWVIYEHYDRWDSIENTFSLVTINTLEK